MITVEQFRQYLVRKDSIIAQPINDFNHSLRKERSAIKSRPLEVVAPVVERNIRETKICSQCHQELPVSEFGSNSTNFDGRQSYCKACNAAYHRERRQKQRNIIYVEC